MSDDNKPYSHTEEFTKYSDATPLDRDDIALDAFKRVEELEGKLNEAMDKVRKLQVKA